MSLIGGLVHVKAGLSQGEIHRDAITDWFVRHAWTIILLGNIAFWGFIAGVILYA